MKNIRRMAVSLLTLIVTFTFVPVVFAHPLGNFTINHYAGLQVGPSAIAIDFVLDMAEIPAFQEITTFDTNGNGQPDVAEATAYHLQKCAALQTDLSLILNQKPLALTLASSTVEFPAGAGGLPTLRLTCEFRAATGPATQMTSLTYEDRSYSERIGWREIVVNASDGIKLNGDFATKSVSNRLKTYPKDLLSSPLNQREITLGVGGLTVPQPNNSSSAIQSAPSLAGNRSDAFTQLITLQNLSVPTVLSALLISMLWGALHAMTPGHGKTIVGAYLVGSRGTLKHALYLGLTTTITHTLGVFALGLLTFFAAKYIVPEKLFPWMSLLSGLFVVGIGVSLVQSRLRSSGLGEKWAGIVKKTILGSRLTYAPAVQNISASRAASQQHKYILQAEHEHHHDHSHTHASGHDHDHTHANHSHLPPGADGAPITWRSLLALGVSGGIIPCPSALVVLLGAIALNKIGFGLILVLAFSLGLAGALTAIGMMFIYAGRLFNRLPAQGRIVQLIPVVSALIVSGIGAAITIKALMDMGIV